MATTKTATVPEATDAERAADLGVLNGLTPETGATPTRTHKGNGGASPEAVAKLAEIAKAKAAANGKAPAASVPARRTRRTTATAPATETAPETAPAPAPARRTRKAPATPAPVKTTAAKTPVKTGKAPAKTAPATPAPAANVPTERQKNTALAIRLLDLVAKEFGDLPEADQRKIANWIDCVPSGGAGWKRYWPAGFARPTTSGWIVPEGETL